MPGHHVQAARLAHGHDGFDRAVRDSGVQDGTEERHHEVTPSGEIAWCRW